MVAPIDAKAELTIGEGDEVETFTLAMNFRTMALAKAAGFNLFKMDTERELDPFDLAAILRAFALPAHPKLTDEQAFAIAIQNAEAVGAAIQSMTEAFGAQATAGKGNPPKTQQTKKK